MALLTAQSVSWVSGLVTPTLTFSAVNATDTFNPGPGRFLWAKNTNAATRTITITTYNTVSGATVQDLSCTIAATTGEAIMCCFPANFLGDPAASLVGTITYSAAAGVTAALIELPQV